MNCKGHIMLEYNRIDVSERSDVNKTSASKECGVCYHWYLKDIGFKDEPYRLQWLSPFNAKNYEF